MLMAILIGSRYVNNIVIVSNVNGVYYTNKYFANRYFANRYFG